MEKVLNKTYLERRIKQVIILGLIIWALSFYLNSFDTKILMGDEGFTLNCAYRILKGEVPNRDFFSIIPPYSFFPLVLFFKIFGVKIVVSRLLVLFLAFLFFLILNVVLNELKSSFSLKFFCFSVLIPYGVSYWPVPSHHWWVDIFSLLSVFMILISEKEEEKAIFFKSKKKYLYLFLSGLFAQISLLTLQDQGGYFLILLLVYLFFSEKDKKGILLFFLGLLTASIPFLLWILPQSGILKLIQDLVVFPLKNYHNLSGHKFDILSGWRDILKVFFTSTQLLNSPLYILSLVASSFILFILPFLSILSIILGFIKREFNKKVVFIVFILLVSALLSAFHRWSLTNLIWVLPSLFPALVYLSNSSRLKRFFNLLFILFGLIFILFSIEYYKLANNDARFSICGTNGCLRAFSSSYQRSVNSALQFLEVHKKEGDTLFCFGFVSLFNFLTDIKNPTYYIDFPAYHSEKDYERLKEEILKDKVTYVLVSKSEAKNPYFKDFLSFVSKEYIIAFENTYFVIFYQRK